MLTESDARALLHHAAGTIEVGPSGPLRTPRRPRLVLAAAAAAAIVAAGLGIVGLARHDAGSATAVKEQAIVPAVVGQNRASAVAMLRDAGLSAKVRLTFTCRDVGQVLRAEPRAGTAVPAGSKVLLRVADSGDYSCPMKGAPPAPVTGPDPQGIALRFIAFARGATDSLPVDTPVRLYLQHKYFSTIRPSQVPDRRAWQMCSGLGSKTCRLSAPGTLATYRARLRVGPLPRGGDPDFCLGAGTGRPRNTGGDRAIAIMPSPRRCVDGFEVDVYSNDVGQIVAVDLIRSQALAR